MTSSNDTTHIIMMAGQHEMVADTPWIDPNSAVGPALERGSLAATGFLLFAAVVETASLVRAQRRAAATRAQKARSLAFSLLFIAASLTGAVSAAVYGLGVPHNDELATPADESLLQTAALVFGISNLAYSVMQAIKTLSTYSAVGSGGELDTTAAATDDVPLVDDHEREQLAAELQALQDAVAAERQKHVGELAALEGERDALLDEACDARNELAVLRGVVRESLMRMTLHLTTFIAQDSARLSVLQANKTWLLLAKDEIARLAGEVEQPVLLDITNATTTTSSSTARSKRRSRRASQRSIEVY